MYKNAIKIGGYRVSKIEGAFSLTDWRMNEEYLRQNFKPPSSSFVFVPGRPLDRKFQ